MANWTNNVFIDALLLGSKYDTNTLNYQFTSSVGSEWTDTEKTSFIHATNSWSDVANINFSNNASSYAELVEDIYTDDPNNLGAHDVTSNYFSPSIVTHSSQLVGVYNINGDGWDRHDSNGGLSVGGYGYITFVHELGHALGLDHTHADDPAHDPHVFPGVSTAYNDFGTHQLNQNIFSVMSYNTELVLNDGFDLSFGYIAGPMAFDIAAIQYLYGINPAHNNSNTTYTLPDENRHNTYFSSIWDTGGIDEIVYHGDKDINIDLRSATLQNEEGGGGFISSAEDVFGGFTIAGDFTNSLDNRGSETGVVIENAISGSGNDTITGNGANNQINAGKGNDAIRGGGGSDVFIFDLAWGNDKIFDFDHNDKIDFSALSEIAQLNDLTIDYSNNKTLISTVNSSDTLELVSSTLTLSRANFIFSAEEEEKEERRK